jgi:hypothetical protein
MPNSVMTVLTLDFRLDRGLLQSCLDKPVHYQNLPVGSAVIAYPEKAYLVCVEYFFLHIQVQSEILFLGLIFV